MGRDGYELLPFTTQLFPGTKLSLTGIFFLLWVQPAFLICPLLSTNRDLQSHLPDPWELWKWRCHVPWSELVGITNKLKPGKLSCY